MSDADTPDRVDVLVIGAGITGLTAARLLAGEGYSVRVLEKSRGLGGRIATRRREGTVSIDHGAQRVHPDAAPMAALLAELEAEGAAVRWGVQGWVGVPGMSGLVKPLAAGLDIHASVEASRVLPEPGGWRVECTDGQTFHATQVISAVPLPQARRILEQVPDMGKALCGARMAPCWALMLAFEDTLNLPIETLSPDIGPLAWIARNSAKPGRLETPETWVAHARQDWSESHLELEPEQIEALLLPALANALACALPAPVYVGAHRWRYAFTETPLGAPCASLGTLHAGGDWCLGPRIEHGYQSGLALARAVREAPRLSARR